MRRALLISNSTLHGSGYLDHCADRMLEFLGAGRERVGRVLFIPYALHDRDSYADGFRRRLAAMDLEVDALHQADSPEQAIQRAEAVFVGGGNTFRLLNELYRNQLIEAIRRRVSEGMPYMGASAGSNVACVSIKTTNDMPIVQPPSFDALGIVPFNINAHYLDPDPDSRHMGETREQRLAEFHEMNEVPVLGLREGCMLRVEDDRATLLGVTRARLFQRDEPARELEPDTDLSFLLDAG